MSVGDTYSKEALHNARMAPLVFEAKSPEAYALVGALADMTIAEEAVREPRLRSRSKSQLDAFKLAIGALASDLIRNSDQKAAEGFCYRPLNRGGFSDTAASSRSFEKLLTLWVAMGLMEAVKGYYVRDDEDDDLGGGGRGYALRIRATSSLLELAASFGIGSRNIRTHFEEAFSAKMPVIVKARKKKSSTPYGEPKGKPMKLEPSDRLEEVAIPVRVLNAYLLDHDYNLLAKPRLVRIFNNGDDQNFWYDQGGRLYCRTEHNYQSMPKAERADITIDGVACCEVDVSGSQLRIFYALNGEELPVEGDPYRIRGWDRYLVKGLITAILGSAKLPSRWPKRLSEEFEVINGRKIGGWRPVTTLLEPILEKHPVLANIAPGIDDSYVLQYEESEAVIAALLQLIEEHDTIALPIHDSLLVKRQDVALAQSVLAKSYRKRFGIGIKCKVS